MFLFYVDESGTPEIPGVSDHFVLAAIGIPVDKWTKCDKQINQLKTSYSLSDAEIHVGWMVRHYKEQEDIENFEKMTPAERREAVTIMREKIIQKRKAEGKDCKQYKKNYAQTKDYVHLTHYERMRVLQELSCLVGTWEFARIFAEVIDKKEYYPPKPALDPEIQSFEQIVIRIEKYLEVISNRNGRGKRRGLIIHDNNPSVAQQHTKKMSSYHKKGTFLTGIHHIIETPLFVDSTLTGMVQIADLCAYALKRYAENKEDALLKPLLPRIDRIGSELAGVRHYTSRKYCKCFFCHPGSLPKQIFRNKRKRQ